MKIIKLESFENNYVNQPTIFYTNEGIIVDRLRTTPIICYKDLIQHTKITLQNAYQIDEAYVVQCEIELSIEGSLNSYYQVVPHRQMLRNAENTIQNDIFRAIQWLTWDQKSQFCMKCNHLLYHYHQSSEKQCEACQAFYYPSLSPAVMVLIQRENQLLLARSSYFTPEVYSAIAGFVDLGETAEEAAIREAKEELSIDIGDLEYFGTQSWPFPGSFMIAYKARYLGGELKIDHNEIEDAKWFDIQQLPKIPSPPSISNRLIESTVHKSK